MSEGTSSAPDRWCSLPAAWRTETAASGTAAAAGPGTVERLSSETRTDEAVPGGCPAGPSGSCSPSPDWRSERTNTTRCSEAI